MESPSDSKSSAVPVVDPVLEKLKGEPHRAFAAEELARLFNLKLAKDPEKLAEAGKEMTSNLDKLIQVGKISEIDPGLYKLRLFFDPHQMIEHVFAGGMTNTLYSFQSPIFRLNIGVLSVFIMKDQKKADWTATVRDATIGKDYCLPKRLTDGTYRIGSKSPGPDEKYFLEVQGRYIEKNHLTMTIAGDKIKIEDHKTLEGTRIDHLNPKGLDRYCELAKEFLKETKESDQENSVKRGRFVLNQFIQHHENIETSFFSCTVDSLLV